MTFCAKILLCFLCFGAFVAPQATMLSDAWREYDYQNFSGAYRLFGTVISQKTASQPDIQMARYGQALVVQYRIPGGDAKKALPLYKQVLAQVGDTNLLSPALYLNIAKAYRSQNRAGFDSASLWLKNILSRYPGSLYAHEAALETAYLLSYTQTKKDFLASIDFLKAYCAQYPSNAFASTMYLFNSSLALGMKNYELGRDQLIMADSVGVINIRRRPTVVYQIGYISEKILHDKASALKYYNKLIESYPTDQRITYCQMRIDALKEQP